VAVLVLVLLAGAAWQIGTPGVEAASEDSDGDGAIDLADNFLEACEEQT
jgi:hypothetical protein